MTVKRSLFRSLAAVAALLACTAITACAAFTAAPGAAQVVAIQSACALDAGLRPTVTMLVNLPGLATPAETDALTAAHAVIDPVCANPSGSVETNTLAVFSEATSQIVNIVADLQSRKAKAAPEPGAK